MKVTQHNSGMSTLEFNPDIIRTSKITRVNVTTIDSYNFDKIDFKDKYSGFSEHTIGMNAPLIAVARGARIIEKHFTLSKKMHGPDHQGSMEPNELRQLVKSAREIEEFMSK